MASTESSSKSASSRGLRNGSGRGGGSGGNTTRSDRGENRGDRDRGETRGDRGETRGDRDRGETRGDRGETRGDRDRGETRSRGNKDSYEPRRGGRGQQHDEGSDRDHHYVGQHQNEGRRGSRQQSAREERDGGSSHYQSDNRRDRDDGSYYDSRRGPERGIRVQPPPRMRNKVPPHPAALVAAAAAGKIEPNYEEHSDKNCIVCYKEVKYYSVGACNHSVCYECSGRMRVLMEQNECPICRQTLEIVIFTKGLKPFKELKDRLRMFILLPQWGLYLEGEDVNRDFEQLLEHRCPYCHEEADTFPTFKDLKRHVQRDHEMYSCDLCSDNIKLFSRERCFYTRQELATHKRKGDRNDKSHRGHPLCEFCDRRYFDHDELYKHLRKDHYFCHFCDADGFNHYYNTYDDLRLHFRKEHFLCEEENCKEEKFTSVFRTEIDMKAHLTAVHSRLLGKHGTKQARMIDLEFNIKSDEDRRSRRFNGEGFVGRGGGRRERGGDHGEEEIDDVPRPVFEPPLHPQPKVDSVADFPMLEGAAAARVLLPVTNGSSHANSSIAQKVALSSGRNVINKQSGSGGGGPKWNAKSRQDEEFPALGLNDQVVQPSSRQFVTTTASTVISTKKPTPPVDTQPAKRNGFARPTTLSSALEEFPSLGNPTSSANGTAWAGSGVKMKKGKQTPRTLKVAAPPLERKIEVDPYDSFQFVPLSVSRARKDSLSKKYECIIANDENDDMPPLTTEKKKKNKTTSSSNEYPSSPKEKAKAVAALFNGKSPENKDGASSSSSKTPTKPTNDDFPSLEPVKKSTQFLSTCKKSPSPSSPRPNKIAPPPGFGNATPKSGTTDLFDLSFLTAASNNKNHNNNNISEDLELLKAKAGAVGKLYSQPPEFTRRNGRLLEAIKSSLNRDESSFEMFKSVSNQYRRGELESKEYYELCQDLFGVTDFRVIFPELVALLPEIEKQQELLASHRRSGGIMKDLSSCHECFQVIKAGDMAAHIQSHSAAEVFPAL
ncbi:E3 ubiquitin-protein ligase ZNF598 isoform X4 [Folsomia candida]|uniref:E3 ubiquitin-protein ligase ZNF598 isoform X3 n=1 Tax=Folsomia candida TaxID=158441 RepID=UPI001604BD37|nr:E3 ubiquitin-protein ligase ZNF598 isoform X3 [Folsomia candida]XP_035700500.1 E3 ubiquitin-protein ligase ZNF598 isoform X4 [Folsomia candida]